MTDARTDVSSLSERAKQVFVSVNEARGKGNSKLLDLQLLCRNQGLDGAWDLNLPLGLGLGLGASISRSAECVGPRAANCSTFNICQPRARHSYALSHLSITTAL